MDNEIFESVCNTLSVALAFHKLSRDDQGRITSFDLVYCNQTFLQLFQCASLEQVKQTDMASFFDYTMQDMRQMMIGLHSTDKKIISRLYSKRLAKLLKIEVGKLNDDHVSWQILDITDSFLRDGQFDDFLNDNLMLGVMDEKGLFLNVNGEFGKILGYEKDELLLDGFMKLVHPEDKERSILFVQDIFNKQLPPQSTSPFMNRIRQKQGGYRYVSWQYQLQRDVIFASAIDVSDTILTQQKLMDANEQLLKHAAAIQKANEHLEMLSMTDMLTGIYNRRYINRKINEESKRMLRYNYPLSMIFFDVDHFKAINDTFGHVVGDEVLKIMCDLVTRHTRVTDIFGRWGGEEFVVIAPHTNQADAVALAEKLRSVIEEYEHPLIGKFTCSFGVVEYNRKESIKELYERADDALYHAKMDGRNRVITTNQKEDNAIESVYLNWDPSIETGNVTIDRQHMNIVKRANDLINLLLVGEEAEVIYKRMKTLMEHISEHFATEHVVLEKVGYPDLLEHKKMHHKLEEKGEQFIQEYQEKKLRPTAFFAFVVDDVVFGHLMKEDKQYVSWLKAQKQL